MSQSGSRDIVSRNAWRRKTFKNARFNIAANDLIKMNASEGNGPEGSICLYNSDPQPIRHRGAASRELSVAINPRAEGL